MEHIYVSKLATISINTIRVPIEGERRRPTWEDRQTVTVGKAVYQVTRVGDIYYGLDLETLQDVVLDME